MEYARSRWSPKIGSAVCCLLLAGCGASEGKEGPAAPAQAPAPTAAAGAPSGPTTLRWTRPESWIELPPAQFRDANFRIAGDEHSECYLSTLAGEGGGLAANVNRWRTQMSLEPLGDKEIAALPRQTWLGKPAVFVDFTGTWTGMGGDAANASWRLVGLLLVEPNQSRFLKMTGPAAVIAQELESFRALAASFREESVAAMPELPAGHPPLGSMPDSAAAVPAADGTGSFRWTAPAGWTRGPEKPMRDVTFLVDGAECYVTLLSGDGGGLLANVNRWCQQLGRPALTESELAVLQRVPMLGGDGVLVELSRDAGGSGPEAMLGVVRLLDGQSLFVKMTGPRALLERERGSFLEFCRSAKAVE